MATPQPPFRPPRSRKGAHPRSPAPVGDRRWNRYRSVRHCMEPLQRVVGVEGYTRGIAHQQQENNVGIWRQHRGTLLHLVEGEIAVVGEVYPAREWLGCLLKGLLPIVFQWRRTYYDRDIFCRGCNLQHVLEQPGKIIFPGRRKSRSSPMRPAEVIADRLRRG